MGGFTIYEGVKGMIPMGLTLRITGSFFCLYQVYDCSYCFVSLLHYRDFFLLEF